MDKRNLFGFTRRELFVLAVSMIQVGLLSLLIAGGALVLGLWIDRLLGTRPWFTLALLLFSIPIDLWAVWRTVFSAARRLYQQDQPSGDGAEDTERERDSFG